ncbi:MAG: hypothetical protein PHO01_01815 [Desulfotomaculaceae bacterium]|nr:hypothetical protein [Desulfotomaculaceae bacterium]
MTIDPADKRAEIVNALASTIQEKIMLPAEEKTSTLKYAINEANERIDHLEHTLFNLTTAHRRTKAMAVISLLGLLILFTVQMINI